MHTPAPTPIRPQTFADRFWAQARGPETDDVPEPLRSVVIVRHFLAVLAQLDTLHPRKAAPALVAMVRTAELDGDLSYASPEQVRGEILDTRSIVFSLGVVLFERLTGRHPFGAENNRPRRVERIRKGELGSGVNSFPTVAAGLRSVLVRAMSPFAEERWPDLRQMRELLQQFVTQEAPAPRLPGTQSDATLDGAPVEQTRVVRMATDFGRELMQVVAAHDRPEPRAPSNRLVVPTAGVGAPRRSPQATPKAGVAQLRSVPPPLPAARETPQVIERIDPFEETRVGGPQLAPAPVPVPPPAPVLRAPTPAFPDVDLRSSPHRRTVFIAIGSGLLGASIAIGLFVGLGSDAPPAPAAAAVSDPVPVPRPALDTSVPAPAAVPDPAPAAIPAPAPLPPPPAPTLTVESQLAEAITPCLERPRAVRQFGLSVLFSKTGVQKAYLASNNPLAPSERGCVTRTLRGLALSGAPDSGVEEMVVRAAADGIAITRR